MFTLLASLVAAQNCQKDLVVDDFAKTTTGFLPDEAPIPANQKFLNLLGGDYGSDGANFTINTSSKTLNILADAKVIQAEPESHPNTAPTVNYWFTKFDLAACYDLTGYTGIAFDLIAPTGSDMNFTLTQKNPFCRSNPSNTTRLVDSVYRPLSSYITPNGQKQAVFLPFKDFGKNLLGGDFDFVHLKDWTAVNLVPVGAQFTMSNLVLKGNCTTNSNGGSNGSNAPKGNSAASLSGMASAVLAAIAGAIAL